MGLVMRAFKSIPISGRTERENLVSGGSGGASMHAVLGKRGREWPAPAHRRCRYTSWELEPFDSSLEVVRVEIAFNLAIGGHSENLWSDWASR